MTLVDRIHAEAIYILNSFQENKDKEFEYKRTPYVFMLKRQKLYLDRSVQDETNASVSTSNAYTARLVHARMHYDELKRIAADLVIKERSKDAAVVRKYREEVRVYAEILKIKESETPVDKQIRKQAVKILNAIDGQSTQYACMQYRSSMSNLTRDPENSPWMTIRVSCEKLETAQSLYFKKHCQQLFLLMTDAESDLLHNKAEQCYSYLAGWLRCADVE